FSPLIEAHKTVRTCDQIVNHSQARKGSLVAEREMAAMRAISASVEFQAAFLETLQVGAIHPWNGFINAIEVNIESLCERNFHKAQAAVEIRMIGPGGNEHPQFFSTQGHVRSA